MLWRILTVSYIILLGSLGHSQTSINVGIGLKFNVPVVSGVPWSTLGIVADGVTDNTSALNSLPTNQTVYCDTGSGTVRFNSQWVWQSNLTLYLQNCPIVTYESHIGSGKGTIDQSDRNTALTNVFIDGLNICKSDLTYAGLLMHIYINHFTLTNWRTCNTNGLMFVRGSDQLIAFGKSINSAQPVGNPGIRHLGNVPKVATRTGQANNVWIHDNTIESGDATYQNAPSVTGTIWSDVDQDDYLWENNFGFSWNAPFILIAAIDANASNPFNAAINNVTYKNMSGAGGVSGTSSTLDVDVANQVNPKDVSNINLTNLTIDASNHSLGGGGSITILGKTDNTGYVKTVTMSGITVKNPYQRGLVVQGTTQDITFDSGVIQKQRTTVFGNISIFPSASSSGVLRTTISNSTITTTKTGIAIGALVRAPSQALNPSLLSNTILGIGNNGSGIQLIDVDAATVTGNTITPAAGTTKAIGVTLTSAFSNGPGTTNSTVTGNNVSAMTNSPTIICAPGQGNTVTGNTGAANCSP